MSESDRIMLARAAMPVTVTAAETDGDKGIVEALVSAYDVRYRMGFAEYHTIRMGAFAESLAERAAFPLFWMHAWDWTEQPPIGHATGAEVSRPKLGLKISGELYLDQPGVASVFRAMKAKALREWSIGYNILAFERDEDDDANIFVTKAQLMEASSVLRGANPETETLKVAADGDTKQLRRTAAALSTAGRELARLVGADAVDDLARKWSQYVISPDEVRASEANGDGDAHVDGGESVPSASDAAAAPPRTGEDPELAARRVEFAERMKRLTSR